MISLKRVTKHFGRIKAVDEVSFAVDKGEIIGFLGPNGAGKTTTMRLITGFLRPSAGTIKVDGLDPNLDRVRVVQKIGYLPENNPLYVDMKVEEYLHFIVNLKSQAPNFKQIQNPKSKIQSHPPASQARKLRAGITQHASQRIARLCGIEKKLNVKIEELSRGYKQRVGLAAAMLGDPGILILDEPTSGLDPNQVVEMRALIKQLGQEKTVILSTHILQEVEAMCNRVIIINQGQLVYDEKVPRRKGQLEKIFRKVTLGEGE